MSRLRTAKKRSYDENFILFLLIGFCWWFSCDSLFCFIECPPLCQTIAKTLSAFKYVLYTVNVQRQLSLALVKILQNDIIFMMTVFFLCHLSFYAYILCHMSRISRITSKKNNCISTIVMNLYAWDINNNNN